MYDQQSVARQGERVAKNLLRSMRDELDERGDGKDLYDLRETVYKARLNDKTDWFYAVQDAAAELDASDFRALTVYVIDDLENCDALEDLWTHTMDEILSNLLEVMLEDWYDEL